MFCTTVIQSNIPTGRNCQVSRQQGVVRAREAKGFMEIVVLIFQKLQIAFLLT